MTRFEASRKQYQKAVARLDEILQKEKNEINRDAAIKRFEFTFDLSWKAVKAFLEEEKGIICLSPKECLREAYRQALIEYEDLWLAMTDWRNQSVHRYSEEFASDLYKKLPEALKSFQALSKTLGQ